MNGRLQPGDRVEHILSWGAGGTVEHVDDRHVRVRWDDGKVGLLYFDETMVCKARHLVKLAPSN